MVTINILLFPMSVISIVMKFISAFIYNFHSIYNVFAINMENKVFTYKPLMGHY